MITAFCGGIGTGKTSLMTAFAIDEMIHSTEKYIDTCLEIEALQEQGYIGFEIPPQNHCVASNFKISVNNMFGKMTSYRFNPFKLSLPNKEIPFDIFPPNFSFYITEGQAIYDSRKSKGFRSCVSRMYENSRHNGWNIYIDAQRIMLLDKNIRELITRVICPISVTQKTDKFGFVDKTIWTYYEFMNWQDADNYLTTGISNKAKKQKYVYEGNIFDCYNSFENKRAFYPIEKKEEIQFSYLEWDEIEENYLLEPKDFRE